VKNLVGELIVSSPVFVLEEVAMALCFVLVSTRELPALDFPRKGLDSSSGGWSFGN